MRPGKFISCCVCLIVSASDALAEELRDPTRPPTMALSGGLEQVDKGAPILQSVLIGPERRSAIIDGQVFQVGARVGDARLERIEEDRVVLRSGANFTTLPLFPVVNMKLPQAEKKNQVTPSPAAPSTKTRKLNRKQPATDPSQ
jgi:MSHA biogenesis protein MshK